MCFGMTTTGQQSVQPSTWLQQNAQKNIAFAGDLANKGFNAPLQNIVGFDPTQLASFSAIDTIAGAPNANNPFYNQISNDFSSYGAAPASRVPAPSVLGWNVDPRTANLNQYIDPYLNFELTPTLQDITRQALIAKNGPGGVGAQATGAGAYGDARQGVEDANVDEAAMRQAAQSTAGAYQTAFQNAAALRGTDVSNIINTGALNANLNEQALNRVLGAGSALQNFATQQTGQGINLAQANLSAGNQQQQLAQQGANAVYNQALQDVLGPWQYVLPGLNQTEQASATGSPTTTTTTAPNNALWNLLGTVLGSAAQGYGKSVSDERLKLDMERIGSTNDGLPIYSYRYVPAIDPRGTPRIGLSAQDVEKVYPDAVSEIGGFKAVDYGKATAFSRLLGAAFAGDFLEAA